MKTNPAIAALRLALEISPDNLPLHRHPATTLAANGQVIEAKAALRELLRDLPTDEWLGTAKDSMMYFNQSDLCDAGTQYLQTQYLQRAASDG